MIKDITAQLLRELEAAHIIIEQFERQRKSALLDRSFTIRRVPRTKVIALAKAQA